ncbi:glycosyltransferase [Fluviibacter phosphoraccumulans]|uniref:glycosyltransferase n=1 Tax=Fluviibacter phosphoraccumulans TaxID=1751046 RepID=UPI0010B6C06A|nr:glycosyltransferase [Fluviibacter phosphoraccumulans]BCA66197.1 rhamnosyltransferase [Fluviibacter phosphoraccumulans]
MNATIIVLYKPGLEVVCTIKEIASQKNTVIAVVNEASDEIKGYIRGLQNIVMLENETNIGLASALNQGMQIAFEIDADTILFLDQDSKPYHGMDVDLKKELDANPNAMICPTLVDIKQKKISRPIRYCDPEVVVGMATSGTFLKSKTAKKIGLVKDELFIDGIDHEWCFRAKHFGIKLLRSRRVVMRHNMGDRGICYMGKHKPIHDNPIRHYYIIRNFFYLARLNYVPFKWKAVEFFKTLRRVPIYVLTSREKTKTSKLIARGVIDGVLKRWGKLV